MRDAQRNLLLPIYKMCSLFHVMLHLSSLFSGVACVNLASYEVSLSLVRDHGLFVKPSSVMSLDLRRNHLGIHLCHSVVKSYVGILEDLAS
jgi:hypothetical protein